MSFVLLVTTAATVIAACFDRTRNPSWVMQYLTKNSLQVEHETDRANSKFMVDNDVPVQFQVHPNRYTKSGYDKGHLAPARMLLVFSR